jgi:UDP-N-acetylmuramoylalanine--D-glutamate ligase
MELREHITQVLTEKLTNRSIYLVGLGKEGFSTYQTIRTFVGDIPLHVVDDKPQTELTSDWQTVLTQDNKLTYMYAPEQTLESLTAQVAQSHSANITQAEAAKILVLKTPGIPFNHQFFSLLSKLAELAQSDTATTLTYSSNIELFLDVVATLPFSERPKTIGITGTKGKSTTTAMIDHVLKSTGKPVFLAGNIGVPALDLLKEILATLAATDAPPLNKLFIVLELSSHQLQNLPHSPHIAVVQNITPEHLDYYKDFAEYVAAKAAIVTHQTESDYVIYNPEYEIPSQFAAQSKAQNLPYSLNLIPMTKESEEFLLTHPGASQVVAYRKDEQLYYETELICSVADLPLKGEHNILNTFPAIIVAKLVGIDAMTLKQAIQSFTSLPHRLEFVAEKNGVAYYNDSQGTTPEASIAAMRSFPGREIILLAGGSDKGVEFSELAAEILTQKVTNLILFPPTGQKIEAAVKNSLQQLQIAGKSQRAEHSQLTTQSQLLGKMMLATTVNSPSIQHVSSMSEAVTHAAEAAQPGNIVLLSPACASFGLFKNYQDRGDQFKAAVQQL